MIELTIRNKAKRIMNHFNENAKAVKDNGRLSIADVQAVLVKDRCEYCGVLLDNLVLKCMCHKIALRFGGHNDPDNLALCCDYCNRKRRSH
jgi:5-methylcytosine-specific restriction endonuclease McrA